MSLSHTPSQEHPKVPQLTVSAIPAVPVPEKKPGAAEQAAEQKSQPAQEAPTDAAAQPAAEAPTARAQSKHKWQEILLDTLLVLAVVGVLGSGGYYLKGEWDKYRVPTMMELAYSEWEELCTQRETLQDAYNHADEQLHMRNKLSAVQARLETLAREAADLNNSIAEHQSRILALQHDIRRADKDARSVARGLLPGLPIGDITTTRGKTYTNATISRLNGKRLALRTPYGAASVPLNELIKEKLPEIARYALGYIDLVDMSDFTANGEAPGATPRSTPKRRTTVDSTPRRRSYEPTPGAPVVDTQSNRTPLDSGEPLPTRQRPASDVWQAPTGDLPL